MNTIEFKANDLVYRRHKPNRVKRWFILLITFLGIILFLPWTQNIRAKGKVTTLRQEQRPQEVNTIIGGRIEKWYVREGDFVKKGDTLLQLSEIKADYLDPRLMERTSAQINAKKNSVEYYKSKAASANQQISALQATFEAKKEQLSNKLTQVMAKIRSDSMELQAAENDLRIATLQYNRQRALHDSGLVSLTQLEQRNQAYQNAMAKKISAENKLLASRQDRNIINIEFSALLQENMEKIAKAEGDKFGSLSVAASGEGDIAKLETQYASYSIRNGMYYIIAPQNGQIIRAKASGIGEVIKEGDMLVSIVPDRIDYAIELYVRPVDLPLVAPGQEVRFMFDGFPAIVFSGWPDASYGTYSGIVAAVESDVSPNGKFKVLVREDPKFRKWPKELRIGTGASAIALLKNVPVWYELWRNINSFPPDYYKPVQTESVK